MNTNRPFLNKVFILLLAGVAQVHAAFLAEDFELYAEGTNLNAIGKGWGGSAGVLVTNINYSGDGGSRSAFVPGEGVASNAVNAPGATYPRIWTETCIRQDQRLDLATAPLVMSGASVMLGVDTGGHLTAYDPAVTNWVAYAADVWGSNVTLAASEWARISVMHNFSDHTACVFLNGHLMKAGLAFMTNLDDYGSFRLNSFGTNSLLDNACVSNAVPAALTTVDLDHDGMADAMEIQSYGDVATWRRLTNTVSSAGNGTITPSGTFTVIAGSNMTYALTAAVAYVVAGVTTNGGAGSFTGTGARTAVFTDAAISNDRVVVASFSYDGRRYVPGDYATLADALVAAQANERVVVSNGDYAESVTLSNGVSLIGTNMGGGATLTLQGNLTVVTGRLDVAGGAFTVTGQVSVAAGGVLTVTNATLNFGSLVIGAGGRIHVVNGSLTVGVASWSGDFTLDEAFMTTLTPAALNFSDGFETYPSGTTVRALGSHGWSASDSSAVVVSGTASAGTNAVLIPAVVVISNTVEPGHVAVWSEVYVNGAALMTPETEPQVNSNLTVQLFVGTNGYVSLYNPALPGWDVCSNDAASKPVARVVGGQWIRINVYQDFTAHTAAVFLENQLLRAQVPFISNTVAECHGFTLEGGTGGVHLDAVKQWTSAQGLGLTGDVDGDGLMDAEEIQRSGNLTAWPRGSIFKIR